IGATEISAHDLSPRLQPTIAAHDCSPRLQPTIASHDCSPRLQPTTSVVGHRNAAGTNNRFNGFADALKQTGDSGCFKFASGVTR
ncbi:MAG TPA: hypothetical protein VGR15_00040, partial [Bacteroidota bacterium]|nr:hypothetical protein [Bacteroidota bacterium]